MTSSNAIKALQVLLVLFMAGCTREDSRDAEIRRLELEIAGKIAEIPQVIERGGANEFGMSLKAAIARLPDRAKQIEWCKKAFDVVFNIDISHLEPGYQYNSIRAVDAMWTKINGVWCRPGNPFDRSWDMRLRYFGWVKNQIDRCKREYTEIEPKTHTRPIPLSIANRAAGLKNLIEFISYDFDARIARHEHDLWVDKDEFSPGVWADVKKRLETLLDRPIRTLEQLEENHKRAAENSRRMKAAEAQTNRPPPLILIDGTK